MADVQSKSSPRSTTTDNKGLLAAVASSVFDEAAAKMIAWEYDEFFRDAKFESEKERRVREILIENKNGMMLAAGRAVVRAGDEQSLDDVAAAVARRDRQLAEVLTPQEIDRFRAYESPEKIATRLTPDRLAKLFPDLMPDKGNMAGRVLGEELKRQGTNPASVLQDKDAYRQVCDRVRLRLQPQFDAEEMRNIEGVLERLGNTSTNAAR